jgi:hypothetical protein
MLCLVCAAPCWAADPLAGLLACRELTDAAARLACFDRETAALARAPSVPIAAAPSTATPASPAAPIAAAVPTTAPTSPGASAAPMTPEQKFGLSSGAISAKEEAAAGTQAPKESKLQAHINGLALVGDGRTLFTLDNAQVWRQLEADGTDVMAKLGDAVTISRGILGSYWLQLKTGRGCKVTRLR